MTTAIATAQAKPQPDARAAQVVSWIVSGASEHDIRDAIAATWPGVTPKPLIVEAMSRLAKAADPDHDSLRGFLFEAVREMYRLARESGDIPSALKALKLIKDMHEQ